jgi:hypothetical protein
LTEPAAASLDKLCLSIFGGPSPSQQIQRFTYGRLIVSSLITTRLHPVPPQQAMLVLRQSRQRHEEDPFLAPPRLGGDGEHLRG